MRGKVRDLVEEVLFRDSDSAFARLSREAKDRGILLSSIKKLYLAYGRGEVDCNFTVPAVNLRGMTYDTAKTLLNVASKMDAFWVFEIARSEMGYTGQDPRKYIAQVIGAAIEVGWKGPLFVQGDHFQFKDGTDEEMQNLKKLIDESIEAGFMNIDIDGSTLVDLGFEKVGDQQRVNIKVTKELVEHIRSKPGGEGISIGGEIGHIGDKNSTSEDVKVFLDGLRGLNEDTPLSKISIQTGTRHGGVIDVSGKTQNMEVDWGVVDECGSVVRKYGLGGVVQHGASTLSDEQLGKFAKHKVIEVHLATGWQNLIMDDKHFPGELRQEIEAWVLREYGSKYESREECVYRERKRAWGEYQKNIWNMETSKVEGIMKSVELRGEKVLKLLNMTGKLGLVKRYCL